MQFYTDGHPSRTNLCTDVETHVAQKFLQKAGLKKIPTLTRFEFSDFLDTKTGFYNERLFHIIEKQDEDALALQELLNFLDNFATSENDKKIGILFKLFDLNDDGRLDWYELHKMLEASMLENGLQLESHCLDELTRALLEGETDLLDLDETGGDEVEDPEEKSLDKEGFLKLFTSHKDLLVNLCTIIDKLMLLPQERPKSNVNKANLGYRIMKNIQNNPVLFFWIGVYFSTNVVLFVSRYLLFITDEATKDSSVYLAIARSTGWCLDFNCAFILIAMLRHSLTRLRSTRLGQFFPIDDHRYLHELCGKLIAAFGLVHMLMHLLNVGLSIIPDANINTGKWNFLQFLFDPVATPNSGLYPGCAYTTGFFLIVVLTVMVLLALPQVRGNGNYHSFYVSHHVCYPIFYVILILHCNSFWLWFIGPAVIFFGEQLYRYRILRKSTTVILSGTPLPSEVTHLVIKRPPGFKFYCGDYVFINIPKLSSCEWHPFTISSAPESLEELTLHIRTVGQWTKSLYNYYKRLQVRSSKLIQHPPNSFSGTQRKRNKQRPSLNTTILHNLNVHVTEGNDQIQSIAAHSSHSVTNRQQALIPERDDSPIPVNSEGDVLIPFLNNDISIVTTNQDSGHDPAPHQNPGPSVVLIDVSEPVNDSDMLRHQDQLEIHIDGPYGAPTRPIFEAEHAVLIGAGIGVTPFASILQSIMLRHRQSKVSCWNCHHVAIHGFQTMVNNLKKVDFFWVNREQNSLGWFTDLLSKLEIEQEGEQTGNFDRFLDIHMYITQALKRDDMRAVALHLAMDLHYSKSKRDAIVGLKSRTKAGRPDWNKVFQNLETNRKGKVVVFYCGPLQLARELKKKCKQFGFEFRREIF